MKDPQNIPPLIDYSKELQVKVRSDNSSPGWTGVRGKTGWDWLQLFLVPLLLAGLGYWFTASQHDNDQRIADANRQADIARQTDQQREAALQAYLDHMSDLLLGNNTGKASLSLASAKSTDEVSQLAQARTFTVLRSLDGPRKGIVLEFLYEAHLIGYADESGGLHFFNPIIVLGRISQSGTASLTGADLTGAVLTDADLVGAVLSYTRLTGADLAGTALNRVDLTGADLTGADLTGANLFSAGLPKAVLKKAVLRKAFLGATTLAGANLEGADLTGAILAGVDLCQADLKGAIGLTITQKDDIVSLQGATLPDGSKVPGQCSS